MRNETILDFGLRILDLNKSGKSRAVTAQQASSIQQIVNRQSSISIIQYRTVNAQKISVTDDGHLYQKQHLKIYTQVVIK
jgi:hypothetical protein